MAITSHVPKLFIVGCPRSGTTWLHDIVRLAPGAVDGDGESHLLPFLFRGIEGGANPARPWAAPLRRLVAKNLPLVLWARDFRMSLQPPTARSGAPHAYSSVPKWVEPKDLVAFGLLAPWMAGLDGSRQSLWTARRLFDAHYARHATATSRVLVEKTPRHSRYAERLLEAWPEARVVEMIRDVRDVALSLDRLKTSWAERRGVPAAAGWWREAVTAVDAARARFPDRVLRVRYEDLRRAPAAEVRRVLDFAGLPASDETIDDLVARCALEAVPAAERGEGKHRRKGLVGEGRTALTDDQLNFLRRALRELAAQHGYEL